MSSKSRSILADNILAVLSISSFLLATITIAVVSNGVLLRQTVHVESFPGNFSLDRLLTFLPTIALRGTFVIQDHRIAESYSKKLDKKEALQIIDSIDVVKFCYTYNWNRYIHNVNDTITCESKSVSLVDYGPNLRLGLNPSQLERHAPSVTDKLYDLPPSKHGFPKDMTNLQSVDVYSLVMIQWAAIGELKQQIELLQDRLLALESNAE